MDWLKDKEETKDKETETLEETNAPPLAQKGEDSVKGEAPASISDIKEVVEIRVINPKRTGSLVLRSYMDKNNELVEFKDNKGRERSFRLTKAKKYLDLTKPDDKIEYDCWIRHPIYYDCPRPKIKIINRSEDASKFLKNFDKELEAMKIAKELNGIELVDFARILGVQSSGVNESVVKYNVVETAKSDTIRFMDEWEDPDRPYKQILHRGKIKGVFKETHDSIWSYRQIVMGTSLLHAIQWLKDNDDMMPSIRKEVNIVN